MGLACLVRRVERGGRGAVETEVYGIVVEIGVSGCRMAKSFNWEWDEEEILGEL